MSVRSFVLPFYYFALMNFLILVSLKIIFFVYCYIIASVHILQFDHEYIVQGQGYGTFCKTDFYFTRQKYILSNINDLNYSL